jgi:hypothetical protein
MTVIEPKKVIEMRRKMLLVLIVVLGISFILPTSSFAWRRGSGAGYHGRWSSYGHHGWYSPRVYVGTAFVGPWFVSPPVYAYSPPVYAYSPPVVYSNPVPPPAYAYPDPALTGQYTGENPPGESIIVPGQWVNGKWIPSHRAQVAGNP